MSKLKNKGAYIKNANLIGAGQKPNIQIKPQEFDKALWAQNQEIRVSKVKQQASKAQPSSTTEKTVTPPTKSI